MYFGRSNLGPVLAWLRAALKLSIADVSYGCAIVGSHVMPSSSSQMRCVCVAGCLTKSSYLREATRRDQLCVSNKVGSALSFYGPVHFQGAP